MVVGGRTRTSGKTCGDLKRSEGWGQIEKAGTETGRRSPSASNSVVKITIARSRNKYTSAEVDRNEEVIIVIMSATTIKHRRCFKASGHQFAGADGFERRSCFGCAP